MASVLLIQPANTATDFETRRGNEAIHRLVKQTITIGRGGELVSAVSALRGVRKILREKHSQFSCIHAWGINALSIAAVASSLPLIFSPIGWPNANEVRLLRAIMATRSVHIASPTESLRRRFLERGVPVDRCTLIRPGVDSARLRTRRDLGFRAELGIAETDFIVVAPGETSRSANHSLALFSTTILNVMDRRFRMLVWGRGSGAEQLRRFAKRLKQPSLIDAEKTLGRAIDFEQLLSAADAAIVTAQAPVPTLPIATCMAAGLPIVSTIDSTLGELLEDRHNALLVSKPSPRLLAEQVIDVRDDSSLQWSICDRAKADAYEFFSQSRFREQFASLYQQVSGEVVTSLQTTR